MCYISHLSSLVVPAHWAISKQYEVHDCTVRNYLQVENNEDKVRYWNIQRNH